MISVIIASHNRGCFINRTISSILSQDYNDFEIIVVDDASDSKTLKELEAVCKSDQRITLFKNQKNMGCGATRKIGFEKSRGDYVVFMDDDDFYCDNSFFSKAMEIMKNNSDICFVSGNTYDYIEETDERIKSELNISGEINAREYLLGFQHRYSKAPPFATVFRKAVINDAIINDMEMVNDSSIYINALFYGKVAFIMYDYIGNYLIHENNISRHIKCDFLIENLAEKCKIRNKMVSCYSKSEIKKWWEEQIKVTAYYYTRSKPGISDLTKLFRWIIMHTKCGYINIFKIYLICIIKTLNIK